jgi:hypothetical protein
VAKATTTKPELRVPMTVIQRSQAVDGIIRACDGCQACCGGALTINDPELVVPRGQACGHLNATGCSIHGPLLPKICSGFLCSYLVEPGNLTVHDRPDHVGAIVRLVRNQKFGPPFDRAVHLNECMTEGLSKIFRNSKWGLVLRNDLLAGIPLLCSFWQDALAQEIMHIRYFDGRLRCELTSCNRDGSPILQTSEQMIEESNMKALMIPQGFAFDTATLVEQLGDKEHLVIGNSAPFKSGRNLCFWFTQRQAQLARAAQRLIQDGPTPARNRYIEAPALQTQ